VLDELTGGDEELNREIVIRYLQSLGHDLHALGHALGDGDVADLRRHPHWIVGASRTVGAHAVVAAGKPAGARGARYVESAELERLAQPLRATAAAVSGVRPFNAAYNERLVMRWRGGGEQVPCTTLRASYTLVN
jgi:HPt (histidine-containing phosphotransfer) domain-containing protein